MKYRFTLLTARMCLFLALVIGAVASATVAFASPAEPTMDLVTLQAKLDAEPDGALSGYFRTVVKGSKIETITLDVLALTGNTTDGSALILFEANGASISKYGGIVSGMSGSPVYVDDGGTDKLIGAVSYGDYFTLSGTGLATPIGYMSGLEQTYPIAGASPLSRPVFSEGRVLTEVIVSPEPQLYSSEAAQGALVAQPLESVFIGGLRPGSKMYSALADSYAKQGLAVVPLATRLGSTAIVGGVPFETPLTAGAAVGALSTRGDLWVGGVGTVTYANANTVLAFGHPAFYEGATSLYMMNAWIDGIWPSSYMPYKLARPGALKGEIQQDRTPGIMGTISRTPAEVPITAHATLGATQSDSESWMTSKALNGPFGNPIIPAAAVSVAGERLFDSTYAPGSAETTAIVVVSDGAADYTVRIHNVWDSAEDIRFAAAADVMDAITTLHSVYESGIDASALDIKSVHLDAAFSEDRNEGEIVGVNAPNGIKPGDNKVVISLLPYASTATETVEATINIPVGTPLGGTLEAYSSAEGAPEGDEEGPVLPTAPSASTSRPTIKGLVNELNATVPNSELLVVYRPSADEFDESATVPESIEETVATGRFVVGSASRQVAQLSAAADPSTIVYRGTSWIYGTLVGAKSGSKIDVFGTPFGGTEQLLASTVAESVGSEVIYEIPVVGLTKNTAIRVVFAGDSESTPAEARTRVRVLAHTKLRASAIRIRRGSYVTLSTTVAPSSNAGRLVLIERYNWLTRRWVAVSGSTKRLAAGATVNTASFRWKPSAGTHRLRAKFLGSSSASNMTSYSSAITVTVR